MLSRVAESLFWTARDVERAEDTGRLLHVNFNALLDADVHDHERAWRELLLIVGRDDLFREHFETYTARTVTEFLLWHPANPDSVSACIARARENARGVREQLSSELWEHLNRLHLRLAAAGPSYALHGVPHDVFARIREGSHGFQGVMKATLTRGEAYEFLELGAHLERADSVARVLSARAPELLSAHLGQLTTARLSDLLKSCGAFEACRKQEHGELRAGRVVDFMLRDRFFPRSVLFCLERCLQVIGTISPTTQGPARAIGRISSELAFTDPELLDGAALAALLARVLDATSEAGGEIADAYFTTQIMLPGPFAHHHQQQQQ